MKKCLYIAGFIALTACNSGIDVSDEAFRSAGANAELANESFVRSDVLTRAWLEYRDPASGLIPSNLDDKIDLWDPDNAAADNYAFMVLTAYLLDKDLYNGVLLDMLNAEIKLSSRVGSLPDTYSFSRKDFLRESIDSFQIIFGSSEYIKDGLMPLCEYIGPSPWQDRMMEMLDDLSDQFDVLKVSEELSSRRTRVDEVNGEMLQTLSRIYWMTGDRKYLEWAVVIGDYYLLGGRDLSSTEYLRLRDHGCEIVGGLTELYVTLHYADPEKKKQYQPGLYGLMDRILEVGRNRDGLFYNAVNTMTGEVVDDGIVDNWGYTFNAYYSVYLIDQKEEYRLAFINCIEALNLKYRNYSWENGSHDGYADALESGINLYNRERVPELKEWIDSEMKVMWNMQKKSGLVGGWHGDGNFSRTAIMYALWKTRGVHCSPWRKDVLFGSETRDGNLYMVLTSGSAFQGKLMFDYKRHREILQLPIDYPRINQFPEWFTIEADLSYDLVSTTTGLNGKFTGEDLLGGLILELSANDTCYLIVKPG